MKTYVILFFASFNCWAVTLIFDTDVELTTPGTPGSQRAAKDEKMDISSKSISWIQSSGRVPLLVLPLGSMLQDGISLHLPTVNEWTPEKTERKIDQSLEILAEQMFIIQGYLSDRRPKRALEALNRLQVQFPNVNYLDFLRASSLTMLGNHGDAIEALKKALHSHPNHEEGKNLLKILTQGKTSK